MVPFVLNLLFTGTNAVGCNCIDKCLPSTYIKDLLYCYLEENPDCSDVHVTKGGDRYSYAACGTPIMDVTCGGERAPSCEKCGSDETTCHGECEWTDGKCRKISTTTSTAAPVIKSTTKREPTTPKIATTPTTTTPTTCKCWPNQKCVVYDNKVSYKMSCWVVNNTNCSDSYQGTKAGHDGFFLSYKACESNQGMPSVQKQM